MNTFFSVMYVEICYIIWKFQFHKAIIHNSFNEKLVFYVVYKFFLFENEKNRKKAFKMYFSGTPS